MSDFYTPERLAEQLDVSRESMERLTLYAALLEKWQQKINLVGKSTLPDMWRRHFLDSAQLFSLIEDKDGVLVDLGSGAGFPGLVLAMLGQGQVHLVDSDERKGTFMRQVVRETGVAATVHTCRIEALDSDIKADVVTSRACTALEGLLRFAQPILRPSGTCLFLKGKAWAEELTAAEKTWKMQAENFQSLSDREGRILKITGLAPGRG